MHAIIYCYDIHAMKYSCYDIHAMKYNYYDIYAMKRTSALKSDLRKIQNYKCINLSIPPFGTTGFN